MSSASPERTRKPSWSASQWYIDIGSPGPRTKRLTPTCSGSSTNSVTKPRGPRFHHFMSRTLRTNQVIRPELCPETVQHDVEIETPLAGRSREQRRADERPDLGRLQVAPQRAGPLRTRDDLAAELVEFGAAGFLAAMNDALVQARRAHRELRGLLGEVEEGLAGIVGFERLLGDRAHLRDVPLDHRVHQVVLRRKAAKHRAVADAGRPCDLVDAHVGARRGERLRRRIEHPLEISPRV